MRRLLWGMMLWALSGVALATPSLQSQSLAWIKSELSQLEENWSPSLEEKILEIKLHYYLALTETPVNATELQQAYDLAGALLKTHPAHAEVLLWQTASFGQLKLLEGKLPALTSVPEIEKKLLHIKTLSPELYWGAADRALGVLYLRAPRLISLGDPQKAKSFLKKAKENFPKFPENQLYWAEYLLAHGNKKEGMAALQEAMGKVTFKDYPLQAGFWARLAKQLGLP